MNVGRAAVLLEGEASPISFKLMNIKVDQVVPLEDKAAPVNLNVANELIGQRGVQCGVRCVQCCAVCAQCGSV